MFDLFLFTLLNTATRKCEITYFYRAVLVRPLNAACLKLSVVKLHPRTLTLGSPDAVHRTARHLWSVILPSRWRCAESRSLASKFLLSFIPTLPHLLLIQFPAPVTNRPMSGEDLFLSEIATLIKMFNPTRYLKEILFSIIYICIFYSFYFCHLKHRILQSSFSVLPLKGHKHTRLINNFLCFPNSPASAHTLQHNPESSQTTLAKTTKGYTCNFLHSKVPPNTISNQPKCHRRLLIIPGLF